MIFCCDQNTTAWETGPSSKLEQLERSEFVNAQFALRGIPV